MSPTDEDFDDMHHAIGRPKGSLKGAYRNHYCIGVGSDTARRFEQLGFWDLRRTINDGRDAIYTVNMVGLAALEKWLGSKP